MLLTPADEFSEKERLRLAAKYATKNRASGMAELRLRLIMSHLQRTRPRVYREMIEQFDWK